MNLKHRSSKAALLQVKKTHQIDTLEDALSVDVSQYQGSCGDLFQVRSSINGFLSQVANYTPASMDLDIDRLQSARALVSQVVSSINSGVPSLVQVGSKVQLQEAITLMDKLQAMNVVKQDSLNSVRDQVSQYLSSSNLQDQINQASSLLDSLEGIINQVSSVKSQLYSVNEVNTLETKRTTLDSMIKGLCFDDYDPVLNKTVNDDVDDDFLNRAYRSASDDYLYYEITGENVTETTLRQYVIGGWIRWLDFIDHTYDHEGKESCIYRMTSRNEQDTTDDEYLEDRYSMLFATDHTYRFCAHDTITNDDNICVTLDYSGYPRENTWHFILLMYSFDSQEVTARVRINGDWISQVFPQTIAQVPFTGLLGFFLGNDKFPNSQLTGFNGELAAWNIWYGTNSWMSDPSTFELDFADTIVSRYYDTYENVPYIDKVSNPNSEVQNHNSGDFSVFSYFNTFLEARDYGVAVWLKVDVSRAYNEEPRQLLTYAFEDRTDINTPGVAIAQAYLKSGSIFVEVAFEDNNKIVSVAKEVAPAFADSWFFLQIHFSTTNLNVKAWVQQDGAVKTVEWDDVSSILIPRNVFVTFGENHVLNRTGADLKFKGVWTYAGEHTFYGQPCDASCLTCNGPNSNDCVSCADGYYVDENICKPCDSDCLTCGGCGGDKCTSCPEGKFLVNGHCTCDKSCLTCNGITDHDCTSCPPHQVLVNGKCVECDDSCVECSAPGADNCTKCDDGLKVVDGVCKPICDLDVCGTCNEDGSECTSCKAPKILYNGQCVFCDVSCNTCFGPAPDQCIDCQSPAQLVGTECIVCDNSCETCSGPNPSNCITCGAGLELVEPGYCLPPCLDEGQVRVDLDCQPCDESCLKCSGVTSEDCTDCVPPRYLSNGQCIIPPVVCQDGYFKVGDTCIFCDINNGQVFINDECIDCYKTCKNCNGPNSNDCTDCFPPNQLSNGVCSQENPVCDGYIVDGVCIPCISNCKNCSDPNCDACEDGYFFDSVSGTCVLLPVCDDGYYVDPETGDCVPNPPPCPADTTFDAATGNCIPNPPVCQDGFVIIAGECVPCDSTCATCFDVNSDNCLSCNDPLVFNPAINTCDKPCDTDNGFVSIDGVCTPCDKSCSKCFGPSYLDCSNCTDGLEFVDGVCVPPCDTNASMVLVDGNCLPCHPTCLTCSGISSDECITCPDNYTLENGACVIVPVDCKVDEGMVWVNGLCVPCDSTCETCSGVSNTDCLTCTLPLVLQAGSCINPPPPNVCDTENGQILINDVCFNCSESCKTCSGLNDDECTDCYPPKELDENNRCLVPCVLENGFYRDSDYNCLPCNETCKVCSGPDTCDDCPDGTFLEDGECKSTQCINDSWDVVESDSCESDCDCDGTRRCSPTGKCTDCQLLNSLFPFKHYNTSVCPPCHESCTSCRGSKSTDCTDCDHKKYLLDGQCFDCNGTCAECTNDTNCTACDEPDVLNFGTCYVPCDTENGFFYLTPRDCEPCVDTFCHTCSGADKCDVCLEGYELHEDGYCYPPCHTDNGFFYDVNGKCTPCDPSCKTCNDVSASNCTSCDDAYFLEFGKCLPIKCVSYDYIFDESVISECNSDCECDGTRRCDPSGVCQDCTELHEEYPDLYSNDLCPPCDQFCGHCRGPRENDCTDCINGYYLDGSTCNPCDKTCNNCTGPDARDCITCIIPLVFRNGRCVQPCDTDNGYFYNSDEECIPCDDTCHTCTGETRDSCTSCYGAYILNYSICYPPCNLDQGYTYDDNYNCVPCDAPCETCFGVGSDKCSSCPKGTALINNQCVGCVSFYYEHDESENVDGPSQCSSDCECDHTRRCDVLNGFCEDCLALVDSYPSLYSKEDCPPCNDTCLTCRGPGPNDCLTCSDGFYLGIDDACYPCDGNCKRCVGPTDKECSECFSPDQLVNNECLPPPVVCNETCLTCDSVDANKCLTCADDYELTPDNECKHKNCVSWDYSFDEYSNPLGAHICDDDCECDGVRRCSPSKQCGECLDLVNMFPDIYFLKDCPPCSDPCVTCSGPGTNDCTSCPAGYFLAPDGSCQVCDVNCTLCSVSSTNCTLCPSGYHLNEDHVCVITCHEDCDTCFGGDSDNCITCPPDRTLVGTECVITPVCTKLDYSHDESTNIKGPNRCINDCDCDSSRKCGPDSICSECKYLAALYPTLYNGADCPPCLAPCLTCDGPYAENCTSCPDGYVLLGTVCEPCSPECETCDDVTSNHCISCADKAKILVNGQCIDPPNPPCDDSCLECDGPSPDNCTKCADDKVLTDGACVTPNCVSWDYVFDEVDGRCNGDCDCDGSRRCSPDKYCQECDDLVRSFPSIYNADDCPVCNTTCWTCNGPNADDCLSCDKGLVLVNGTCVPCDDSCAECIGVTDSDCTKCNSPLELVNSQCVPPQPPCDCTCLTCTGSEPNQCIDCVEGYRLAYDGTCQPIEDCVKWAYIHDENINKMGSGRCYDDCDCDGTRRCSKTGFCRECEDLAKEFPDFYKLSDCPVCNPLCLTCDGPSETDCTSCADGFALMHKECNPCDSDCPTCFNAPDYCTSCLDGFDLVDGKCVVHPPVCDDSCKNCTASGAGNCTECYEDYELVDGYCNHLNCLDWGYKFDEANSPLGSGRCNDDCECNGTRRCSPDKICAPCFDLVNEYSLFYDYSDCPPCDAHCLSCDGPTDKNCISCNDGSVLVDGSCVPCDPSCATCKDASVTGCVTCPPGFDLHDDGTCQIHYDCHFTCDKCNGPAIDQCVSCIDGRFLNGSRCILDCVNYDYIFQENEDDSCTTDCDCDGTRRCSLTGYCESCAELVNDFPDKFSADDCQPCDDSCEECYGPGPLQCRKCADGLYLADDSSCQPCDRTCKTCDGPENDDCLDCNDPDVLDGGFCHPPNPVCDWPCKTCYESGSEHCSSCVDHYELVNETCAPINCNTWGYIFNEATNPNGPSTCEDDCECDGTRKCQDGNCWNCQELVEAFPTVFSPDDCLPCDILCKTCNGPSATDCLTCLDHQVLIDGQCIECDVNCLTCFGPDSDNCNDCYPGQVLSSNNSCVNPPPVCVKPCATCSGPTEKDCLSCTLPDVLVDGTCIPPETCDSFDYTREENDDHTCENDCECFGTRRCSDGFCYECVFLANLYPEEFSNCPPCNETCQTCNGPFDINCLSCFDGFYLDEDGHCVPCEPTCLTCGGEGASNCTSCDTPHRVLFNGYCNIPDPVCNETCATCKGTLPTDCIECIDYYEFNELHLCVPIDCHSFDYVHNELFNAGGEHTCQNDCDCDGGRRCSPSFYCEDCLTLAVNFPETYLASDCPPCDGKCKDCDGPTDRNCTDCFGKDYLFNGQCITCDDTCDTCFGPEVDNCITCHPGDVLYQGKCVTPDPNCHPSCVTCKGPNDDQCTTCACDYKLTDDHHCYPIVITCDETCETCWGKEKDQCRTCPDGRVLLSGECVSLSSFVGLRSKEDSPMNYEISKKVATSSDFGLGSWTKLLSYSPLKNHKYNVLFRLSGLSKSDKASGTNQYRDSSLAVYYNETHYTFETYTRSSGVPVLVQKSIPISPADIQSKWNLVFFGYSRKNAKATGFIKLESGKRIDVEFNNIHQDLPEDKMEVMFYGDKTSNGFHGEVSSPEVLHGNNFLQEFKTANHEIYFKLNKSN